MRKDFSLENCSVNSSYVKENINLCENPLDYD